MNSGSNSWYDRYKDRRNGRLFFFTLMVVLGGFPLLWLVCVLCNVFFPDYAPEIMEALVGLFGVLVLWKFVTVCREALDARRRWREKANLSKLSSDELTKARSKLLKQQNRMSL